MGYEGTYVNWSFFWVMRNFTFRSDSRSKSGPAELKGFLGNLESSKVHSDFVFRIGRMLRTPSGQVDSTWLVFLLSCCTHRLGSLRNFWAVSPLMPRRQKRTILSSVSERHSEPKICDDSIFRLFLPVEDLLMWNKRPGGLVVSNSKSYLAWTVKALKTQKLTVDRPTDTAAYRVA